MVDVLKRDVSLSSYAQGETLMVALSKAPLGLKAVGGITAVEEIAESREIFRDKYRNPVN